MLDHPQMLYKKKKEQHYLFTVQVMLWYNNRYIVPNWIIQPQEISFGGNTK